VSSDVTDVLHQPIGQDIITELQSSWENYHHSKAGKFDVVLVCDARENNWSLANVYRMTASIRSQYIGAKRTANTEICLLALSKVRDHSDHTQVEKDLT